MKFCILRLHLNHRVYPPRHTGSVAERAATATRLVHLLLAKGADVYQRDDLGRTALHWACGVGLEEAAVAILEAGVAAAALIAADMAVDSNEEVPAPASLSDLQVCSLPRTT